MTLVEKGRAMALALSRAKKPSKAIDEMAIQLQSSADRVEELEAENAELRKVLAWFRNGNRELPIERDELGRMVREAWVRWAKAQSQPKPKWLIPYHKLDELDKEADRQIGEAIARWTLVFAAGENLPEFADTAQRQGVSDAKL